MHGANTATARLPASCPPWRSAVRYPPPEVEHRLLSALAESPTPCISETMHLVYPELLEELESTLRRLAARGEVVYFYRRWWSREARPD